MQYPKWLNDFVNSVASDLGDREDYSATYLMGWFLTPSNLGVLNSQIDSCYSVTPYANPSGKVTGLGIEPPMGGEELAIYKSNFDVFFYGREAKLSLSGSPLAWTSLREGDSSITRVNRSEMARTFNAFQKDARDSRDYLVKQYTRTKSKVQSVDGADTVSGGYWDNPTRSAYYPRSEPGL